MGVYWPANPLLVTLIYCIDANIRNSFASVVLHHISRTRPVVNMFATPAPPSYSECIISIQDAHTVIIGELINFVFKTEIKKYSAARFQFLFQSDPPTDCLERLYVTGPCNRMYLNIKESEIPPLDIIQNSAGTTRY